MDKRDFVLRPATATAQEEQRHQQHRSDDDKHHVEHSKPFPSEQRLSA
jgi:hypothetical protein